MSEVRIILGAFVWVFVVVILFLVFNTIIIGETVDTFNDIANESAFIDYTNYQQKSNLFVNVFYIMFAIMIIAPFLYLFVRLLFKKEPDPYARGYYE